MNKKILLVEDDLFIRDLYARTLKAAGYDVSEAADGSEGAEKLTEGGYDLVLLDIMLPQKSGLDILKGLKENPAKNVNKKIVMLTNLDKDVVIYDCLTLGAAAYLIKDQITPDNLVDSIKVYLEEDTQSDSKQ